MTGDGFLALRVARRIIVLVLEDLSTTLVLGALALVFARRSLSLGRGWQLCTKTITQMSKHRASRLALFLPVVMLLSWLATATRLGLSDTKALLTGAATSHERDACFSTQVMVWRETHGSSCTIGLSDVAARCPFGGHLSVDATCRITCSLHGRNESLTPLSEAR